jgi:DNA-directed RNA polymerase subunit RPC12/RpoP
MNAEDNLVCPNCGASVAKTDVVCRNCGADLVKARPSGFALKEPEVSVESSSEETEERKYYSVFERLYKLVVSPSDSMEDIGRWPEYNGPIVIVAFLAILESVGVALAYQKIQWIGDPNLISEGQNFLTSVVTIAVLISVVIVIAFWLVKSLLVKALCDNGSEWSFGTAASVTGYAYIADVIFGIIGVLVVYPLTPSLTINVSDMTATQAAIANYQAQILWIRLAVSVPIGFVGLVWKSYLGGLGTKYGTDESSSLSQGFAVFIGLTLLGWLISFILTRNI